MKMAGQREETAQIGFRFLFLKLSLCSASPEYPAGTQRPELAGHGQAQIIVVVQIGLLLLSLHTLLFLKPFPVRAGFVTASLVVGTIALTRKHTKTPLARYASIPKTAGTVQPNVMTHSAARCLLCLRRGRRGQTNPCLELPAGCPGVLDLP